MSNSGVNIILTKGPNKLVFNKTHKTRDGILCGIDMLSRATETSYLHKDSASELTAEVRISDRELTTTEPTTKHVGFKLPDQIKKYHVEYAKQGSRTLPGTHTEGTEITQRVRYGLKISQSDDPSPNTREHHRCIDDATMNQD